jgi:hypothetical protein
MKCSPSNNPRMNQVWMVFVFALLSAPVWAEGKKPPEKQPAEKPSHTLQDAEDDANKVLNDIDHGIHHALPAAKKGANDALEAVDREVHKAIEPKKK